MEEVNGKFHALRRALKSPSYRKTPIRDWALYFNDNVLLPIRRGTYRSSGTRWCKNKELR